MRKVETLLAPDLFNEAAPCHDLVEKRLDIFLAQSCGGNNILDHANDFRIRKHLPICIGGWSILGSQGQTLKYGHLGALRVIQLRLIAEKEVSCFLVELSTRTRQLRFSASVSVEIGNQSKEQWVSC